MSLMGEGVPPPSRVVETEGMSCVRGSSAARVGEGGGAVSHPILEGKPNANHVRARIRTHVHSDYINDSS